MALAPSLPVVDQRSRPLRELRVSVTDRCNFRCTYCMPRDAFGTAHRFLPRAQILSFEEIARTCRVFAALGVRKFRLTGGEPLLRAQLPTLVRMLREIPDVDLALTTNGALLERHAESLAEAGLGRITVSLDSLDPAVFHRMTDTDVHLDQVLRGIAAATHAGFRSLKVNVVVQRGVNDAGLVDIARHFKGTGTTVRFIEFMDVGTTNGWRPSGVVSAKEIVERISAELPLLPPEPAQGSEVARRYRYADGDGEIGVIASVTEPFCGRCSRARISADGHLYTCLFATDGIDLRPVLRDSTLTDEHLRDVIESTWRRRNDRYSELRATLPPKRRIEMSYIGG